VRRKRVLIKLVVESISVEALIQEEAAEKKILNKLREAVLKAVPDKTGYLESDMTVKRFLDARPEFDQSAAMLINHLRWRNEGRYLIGCPHCLVLPGYHVWRQIGFDNEGRPAVFFSLAQVLPKIRMSYKPFKTLIHILDILENGHKVRIIRFLLITCD
jgi:hypothetical protein